MSYAWLLHWTVTIFLLVAVVVGVRAGHVEPVGCVQLPALTGDATTSVGSCNATTTWHKISTQTASAGASMQWTGLGSTYNDYVLQCPYVYPATDAVNIYVQLGEGGTPTWQTANYRWEQVIVGSGASPTISASSAGGTDSGFSVAGGGIHNVVSNAASFRAIISNIPSTTYYVSVQMTTADLGNGPTSYIYAGAGHFTGDTTAKTAIRVIAASGNETGQCSLWGIVVP